MKSFLPTKYIVLIIGFLFVAGISTALLVQSNTPKILPPHESTVNQFVTVGEEGETQINTRVLGDMITQSPSSLSPIEVADLLFMQQEEKLARDTYVFLYETWGLRPFSNISQSEETHMEAVETLLSRYAVSNDLYTNTPFQYSDQTLVGLSLALKARGTVSQEEALRVGIFIEELDINDLQKRISSTNNQDIILVYENLMKGSRNHLRAFYRNLLQQGGSYTPEYLSPEEFSTIASGATERGGGRNR